MRVYIGLFGLFWCGAVFAGLVQMLFRPESLFLVGMLAFGGTITYRSFRMEALADVNGLLVRNYFRTKRFQWAEVEGFRLGSPTMGMPVGKTIYALLTNGEMISLDVTMRLGLLPSTRRKRDAFLGDLRRWTDQPK
jgi:hypothetical protein